MRLLNLGCGNTFSSDIEWTNVDFVSVGKEVMSYNLLKGIPFGDCSFDFVYHSHVLEHFSKSDGENFIAECFRVLKPSGIVRIAVPNLEILAETYLQLLRTCLANPNDHIAKDNYEWVMLEMFDQIVRTATGGEMVNYLCKNVLTNEQFVFERIGEEGRKIRSQYLASQKINNDSVYEKIPTMASFRRRLIRFIKRRIFNLVSEDNQLMQIGRFRLGGEVHLWMYDRYSLSQLLCESGFVDVVVRDAFTSYFDDWQQYNLDAKDGRVRKPDSLFIEARK